ncbi:hypothetical protein BM536_036800 [Streptomyces phaeoluteigriseus]|uniref:Uncharacterized protein n=1 Tax=Streptomyces phaeoluteigriseus TaxID=114686 RepID=A0A1V6MI61_9ACTN|nr:hypothetical protein [Streptomyces phaeoluteigriseus]OQD52003.1 hypothetical protein BM536_036800 [Streptomyces phaeoluteigriseus]
MRGEELGGQAGQDEARRQEQAVRQDDAGDQCAGRDGEPAPASDAAVRAHAAGVVDHRARPAPVRG